MEKYDNLDSRKIYQFDYQPSESDPVRLHAMAEIMRQPMFSEQELVEFFGGQPEALGRIEAQRASSRLLALPTDQGYFYPRFQFDTEQAAIYEAVCEVNQLIEAGAPTPGASLRGGSGFTLGWGQLRPILLADISPII